MDPYQNSQKHKHRREAERERKRALRACDGCRRQKEKCDGGVPCRKCTRLRRQCEFLGPSAQDAETGTDGSSRGRNSGVGPTNSELQKRLSLMEKILNHYVGDIKTDSESLKKLADSVDKSLAIPSAGPVPPRPVSPGSDYLGVDDESFTVKPLDNNTTHYSGEFSHWNFSMRIKQWIEQCMPDNNKNDASSAPGFKEYYRAEELQSDSNTHSSIKALPPRYVADFLINAFYKHAETNYFYVDRTWLTQRLDVIYHNPKSISRREVGTLCMIWIIFAIGTQYAYLDSRTDRTGDPSSASANEPMPFSEDTVGIMFYQQACKLVPDLITIASLESVQACLLIGIYALPLDASGLSYIYLNLAVKLAIQNGMHRKYPAEGLDPVVRETRNRVWWTVYTTEKRVGIYHGRPMSISAKDVDAEMPVDSPHLFPPSNPTNIAHMLATLHLNQALSKISHQISILKTAPRHEIVEGLNRVIELKEELRKWWEALPDHMFRKETSLQIPITRADVHLKIEYCAIRMFAGRAFIFPRDSLRANVSSSGSPAESSVRPSTPSKTNPRSILVADCVDAALGVIDACQLLQNSVGLARASYTEFSSCRAALLVIITQCLQKKTDRLREALRVGLAMMKEMSAGGESARSEVSLIEVFERAIVRLDATAESSGRESDYARFKKWELLWKNDVPAFGDVRGADACSDAMPLPPQATNYWRGLGLGSGGMAHSRPDVAVGGGGGGGSSSGGGGGGGAVPPMSPFVGLEAAYPTAPQVMDEFTSLFGFGFGPSPESMGPGAGNMWMGP